MNKFLFKVAISDNIFNVHSSLDTEQGNVAGIYTNKACKLLEGG
jgi:hypothetical protein